MLIDQNGNTLHIHMHVTQIVKSFTGCLYRKKEGHPSCKWTTDYLKIENGTMEKQIPSSNLY